MGLLLLLLLLLLPLPSLAAPTLPSWLVEIGAQDHSHSHDGPQLIGQGFFPVDAEDIFSVPTQDPEAATVPSNSWAAYGTPSLGGSSGYGYGASGYGSSSSDMVMDPQGMAMERL